MIESIIIVPIMWIVMSAIYMLLLKNFEGTKALQQSIKPKTALKELPKKTDKIL